MADSGKRCQNCCHGICYFLLLATIIVLSVFLYLCKNPLDPTLPRLSSRPRIENVTSSTIEIEWNKDYTGDGPVCGYIVELKPPTSTEWTSVGFVAYDDDADVFGFTVDRLVHDALYAINVRILHCSGVEGGRSPEVSQTTNMRPQTQPPSEQPSTGQPCPPENCTDCPTDPDAGEQEWRRNFLIAVPILSIVAVLEFLVFIG
ncbi:titin-like [Lytechinus pictus]|uniref:titin-like n=1 Tax=Lytechinus pictus TaxID=7653 RepID=UPI0030B9D952